MAAQLDDAPVIHHGDAVGAAHGGKPVGDDDGGASLAQFIECLLDMRLGHAVQGARRLIQDENGRVFEEDARNGDPLLLPAGKHGAALTHVGLEALRHPADILVDLRPPGGLGHLLVGRIGAAVADIIGHAARKEENILLHHPDLPPQRLLRDLPHIMAVDADSAGGHIVKAGDELAQGGFSPAGGADQRHRFTGGNVQRDIVQHRLVLPVFEAHVVDIDGTPDLPQFLGIGAVLQRRLGTHQLHKAVQPRRSAGKRFTGGGKPPDRIDEGGDIQVKGDQVDNRQLALHNERTAHRNHGGGKDAEEEFQYGIKKAHGAVEAVFGIAEAVVGVVEFIQLHALIGKGLGGFHAAQARLEIGIDGGDGALYLPGGIPHGPAAAPHHQQENGDHDGKHQRQPPLDGIHDDQRTDDGKGGDEDVLRPVVRQLGDIKKVAGQAAHQLPRAVLVIKIIPQLLHMPEQVPPDIGFHPHAEAVPPVGDDIGEHRAQHIHHRYQRHHRPEGFPVVVRDQRVKAPAGHKGERQVDDCDHQGGEDIQQKEPQMRLEIGEKDRKLRSALKVLGRHKRLLYQSYIPIIMNIAPKIQ